MDHHRMRTNKTSATGTTTQGMHPMAGDARGGEDGHLLAVLNDSLPGILSGQPVTLAYFYGSARTGSMSPQSDIDIGLVVSESLTPADSLNLILRLKLALEERSGLSNVDIRIINDAPLVFRGRVVTDGVLIYSTNETQRVQFETSTRLQYFDYLPIHLQMQSAFFEDIRKRGLHG
jgi:predicted nucleotidyltransferase